MHIFVKQCLCCVSGCVHFKSRHISYYHHPILLDIVTILSRGLSANQNFIQHTGIYCHVVSPRSRTQATVRAIIAGAFQEDPALVGFNISVCPYSAHKDTPSANSDPTIRDANILKIDSFI